MSFEPDFQETFILFSQVIAGQNDGCCRFHMNKGAILDFFKNNSNIEAFFVEISLFRNGGFDYSFIHDFFDFLFFSLILVAFVWIFAKDIVLHASDKQILDVLAEPAFRIEFTVIGHSDRLFRFVDQMK